MLIANTIHTMSILPRQMVVWGCWESRTGPEWLPGPWGPGVAAGTSRLKKLPVAVEAGSVVEESFPKELDDKPEDPSVALPSEL